MAIGMQRREFITLPSGAAATWPVSVRAQQPTMALVGLLASNSVWFPARAARQGTVEFADMDQIQYSARSMQLESRSNELSDSFVCLSPMCEHC